jgi:hypothetical protein
MESQQLSEKQRNVPVQKRNAEKFTAAFDGGVKWAYFYEGKWWDVYWWDDEWTIREFGPNAQFFDTVAEARKIAGIFDPPTNPTAPDPYF